MGSILKLAIIIVSYNVCQELRNCLQALIQQLDSSRATIIVVDNASTDETRKMISTEFPQVMFQQNPHNVGFAAANNMGIAETDSEYIMFLNPDTVPLDYSIDRLIETLDTHPDAAATGPRAYWDLDKRFLISSLKIPTPVQCWLTHSSAVKWWLLLRFFRSACQTDWKYWTQNDSVFSVPAIGGAYLMVRRKMLDTIGGGFDPDYFLGYEDVDLCYRLTQSGYTLLCCPTAEIVHLYGASKRKTPAKVAHCLNWRTEARQFLINHHGQISAFCVGALLTLEKSVRSIRRICHLAQPAPTEALNSHTRAHFDDITLEWPPTNASRYLIEIATSPSFYDKFGHFTSRTHLLLTPETQSKLTPGTYHWRVFPLPLHTHTPSLESGRFHIP